MAEDKKRVGKREEQEAVTVNKNDDGEATRGTTQDGNEQEVKNKTNIPQNESDKIETTPAPNKVAKRADKERPKAEREFSNESNPNQKARTAANEDEEYDQDGRPRTGGYSYGVAPDDTDGTVPEEQNRGEEPDEITSTGPVYNEPTNVGDFLNSDNNAKEWDVEEQQKLEKELSEPDKGIVARVTTSVGDYVRVKFFRNNKPFGTYRSRKFKSGEAKKFLGKLRKSSGV